LCYLTPEFLNQVDRRTRPDLRNGATADRGHADRLAEIERYPLLVASDAAGKVLGWVGLSSYRPRDCYAGIGEFRSISSVQPAFGWAASS
jgi:L-amino acid N-acyltransferase YncA